MYIIEIDGWIDGLRLIKRIRWQSFCPVCVNVDRKLKLSGHQTITRKLELRAIMLNVVAEYTEGVFWRNLL